MIPVVYAEGEYYHVYNLGVARQPVFKTKKDYFRAITAISFYRFENPFLRLSKALLLEKNERGKFFRDLEETEKIVELVSYCLMPNHFHFLIKQKKAGGVSRFMSDFSNSYTRYFNIRHKRIGPLFQGVFKGVRIESEEQLIHVSRYIHLNPVASLVIKEEKLDDYPWSSLPEYLGSSQVEICEKGDILDSFPSLKAYRKFVHDRAEYAKKLDEIKHLAFD